MKLKILMPGVLGLVSLVAWANWPPARLPAGTRVDRLVVEKGKRALSVYDGEKCLKTYTISLGKSPVGTKEKEGDNKTPEGLYTIVERRSSSGYCRALMTSYPDKKDVARAQKSGVKPGGGIMIHGIKDQWGFIGRAHRWMDWTAGCIALTNPEVEELFDLVKNGTVVEIKP